MCPTNKAGRGFKEGVNNLEIMLSQRSAGLDILDEQIGVFRQKGLAGPPGRNQSIRAEMVISGVLIGDISVL
jgi:hypothetical protein